MDALMLGFLLGFIHKKLKTHLIVLSLSKMQVEWTQKYLVKNPPINNSSFEIGMLLPNDKKVFLTLSDTMHALSASSKKNGRTDLNKNIYQDISQREVTIF